MIQLASRRALRLAPVLVLTVGLGPGAAAAEHGSVPDDCRIEPGGIAGEAATMACYEALDLNGDAALSPEESAALPRLDGRFEELDADGNGLLSPDEFQADLQTPAQRGGGKGI